MSLFHARIFRLACHERAKVKGVTHEKRVREKERGRGGKIDGRSCLSALTRFVPSVNFWLQYQRHVSLHGHVKAPTTSGKTEDVSVTTAFPIRFRIFPTSYFVSFLSPSLSLSISFFLFYIFHFLLLCLLLLSFFFPPSSPGLVVLFLPP